MTTEYAAPSGAPCWIDLMTSDTSRSREFYCGLFGWEANQPDEHFGGYFSFTRSGADVAGCMSRRPSSPPGDVWSVYLNTPDLNRTLEAAAAHGARAIVEAMAVDQLGTMAVLSDAGGAGFGLWQPGTFRGFAALAEPGAPSWFELQAADYDASLAFYREALGWDLRSIADGDDFRYSVLHDGDTQLAGIMDAKAMLGDGACPRWLVYFSVADTDAALARVVELGGKVVEAPQDSPYGRLAVVADATGAVFKVVDPNRAEA